MSSLGFLPDITIIIVGFILLYKFREPIAKLFARIPLSGTEVGDLPEELQMAVDAYEQLSVERRLLV